MNLEALELLSAFDMNSGRVTDVDSETLEKDTRAVR